MGLVVSAEVTVLDIPHLSHTILCHPLPALGPQRVVSGAALPRLPCPQVGLRGLHAEDRRAGG